MLPLLPVLPILAAACPDGWVEHANGRCFRLEHKNADFAECAAVCEAAAAALPCVDSEETHSFLTETLTLVRGDCYHL